MQSYGLMFQVTIELGHRARRRGRKPKGCSFAVISSLEIGPDRASGMLGTDRLHVTIAAFPSEQLAEGLGSGGVGPSDWDADRGHSEIGGSESVPDSLSSAVAQKISNKSVKRP